MKACQDSLEQAKADREQYYFDLANNPDRFATEAAPETVSETVTEETTLPNAA